MREHSKAGRLCTAHHCGVHGYGLQQPTLAVPPWGPEVRQQACFAVNVQHCGAHVQARGLLRLAGGRRVAGWVTAVPVRPACQLQPAGLRQSRVLSLLSFGFGLFLYCINASSFLRGGRVCFLLPFLPSNSRHSSVAGTTQFPRHVLRTTAASDCMPACCSALSWDLPNRA